MQPLPVRAEMFYFSQGRVHRKNSEEMVKSKNYPTAKVEDKLLRRQESINQNENLSNQVMAVFTRKLFI